MDTPLQEQWAKKSRFLTQALIFSGALNIGLLTSFFYFIIREKSDAVAFELQPVAQDKKGAEKISNSGTLANFAAMSYGELIDLLGNQEPIEEGYKKRDLALASLAMFHFVNVEKALQGFPLQKRSLSFQRKEGPEQVDITVYPGLGEDQFKAILQFIKTEKFPFTTQGLFFELQQSKMPRDSSLLDAFYLTPEFTTVMTLFARAGVPLPQEYVVDLLTQGDWNLLQQFTQEQRQAQDLSPDRFKNLLTNYIRCRSLMAAKILLEWDREFILKKFEDPDLMAFIDLFPEKSTSLELLLKELIASPRSDAIWKKAAEKLFAFAGLPIPDPYDHQVTLKTFMGDRIIVPPRKASGPLKGKKTHVVQQGENLWKIARKYKVSIDSLRKANNLQTDKLRPGKELIIMDDLSRPDSKDGTGRSGAP
jgi:hypothetical protein